MEISVALVEAEMQRVVEEELKLSLGDESGERAGPEAGVCEEVMAGV